MTMFHFTPSQARAAIIDCMEVGLVPLITSSPGLGKSSVVAQITADCNLFLIDVRLSTHTPEDLTGLPMKDGTGKGAKSKFLPFDTFPIEGDPIPAGYSGWVILFDEFNSASKSVQAAAYKIVLDRMVGQHKLHQDCYMVCAGNLATDRAIVNSLSTAMQSRLIHIEMIADIRDFNAHAIKAGFDPRILGFLAFQPTKLHSFKPDHQDRTFACSRTWEFASRLIKGKTFEQIKLPLLAGTLSDGIAQEFYAFLGVYGKLPSYAAVCANPEREEIFYDPGTRYAMVTMMQDHFTEESFEDAVKYVRRMPPEFQVVYFRGLEARHPGIRRNKTYKEQTLHLMTFLNTTDDEDIAA